jgi:hypothetical protein
MRLMRVGGRLRRIGAEVFADFADSLTADVLTL